jgi:DNA-3-methyladenine glycosylase
MNKRLPREFYLSQDVLAISKALLGKFLVTKLTHNVITSGMIVDTEAYHGSEDKASHAYKNKRSIRTETMYMEGGYAYVYICYGIHHLLNIVTADKDIPHGVMVRAIEPCDGIQIMLKRRETNVLNSRLTSGPGTLTQALGITINHNKIDLCGNKIWIEDRGIKIHPDNIEACSRVGVSYAGKYAKLPWRFKIKNNPWVSAAK